MKVLFLNYEYPPLGGGAGNATKFLLQEYTKKENLSIDLVTSAISGDFVEMHTEKDVNVFRLPVGKDGKNLQKQSQIELLRYAWTAYWFARNRIKNGEQYDVIHAFFSVPCGVMALALSWEFKVPYIVSLRGADVPGYAERFRWIYGFLRPIIRYTWKQSTHVVSNSEGLKQLALKTNKNQSIDIIYNGVDTDFFHPDTTKRSAKTITILCASRLTSRKGLCYAIEAFSLLQKQYPQLRMILAGGDGDAGEDLRRQVQELHLEKEISFHGEYDHGTLLKLQQASDIFLFPSLNEGMSNSMLEAMASALPVIMTPTGGAQELVKDGKNGYLVKFRNAQDIADKIQLLLENPSLREKMGGESRRVAVSLSWNSVARSYEKIYEESAKKDAS